MRIIFYQLFSQLNKLQDDVVECEKAKINSILGLDKYNKLTLKGSKEELIDNCEISRYFILLYQIMKLINIEVPKFSSTYSINSLSWNVEKREQKKFYTNLIRSQQDNIILQLLFINCFDDGFFVFRRYLEEASFFKHMRLANIDGKGYNYLLLNALPYYVLDEGDLKKSEGIPFFDKGKGLSELVDSKSSYLLRRIYREQPRLFFDFELSKDIFEELIYVRPKEMFGEKHTIKKILFSTHYFIELKFGNSEMDKNLKVEKVIFKNTEVKWVGENGEELILLLDGDSIMLNKMNDANNFEYDGLYSLNK